ncbi:helix-turn-helix domain-containing protein [Desmospora profundinema]|uniref:Transcriptional regulator with XRE-family HTH domain n=1 Tax=Desmospora profundinema TaxID=1571184 RepID=A0ABU1IPC5_9BACL|nr:helix-turn-helix transcriptional regulator [Desmospora profundinema]MDR6226639.1 transcriptional regulator with XRE-family HTH domain [Desmospora profundinema]
MRESMARKLVHLRGARSRTEVAGQLHISVSALQMYENGRRVPRDDIKVKLAQYYGVSVEYLFYQPVEDDMQMEKERKREGNR